jgi:hypothetical protein
VSSASLAGIGFLIGASVVYLAAAWHITKLEERHAEDLWRIEHWKNRGALAEADVRRLLNPHPLGHRLEKWALPGDDAMIAQLTSLETYEGES